MSSGRIECRHGIVGGCYDCLLVFLHEAIRVLNDSDAAHLSMKPGLAAQLKRFMKHGVEEIGRIHISEGQFIEDEEYEDAIEEPAAKRLHPTVVAGSGFGSRNSAIPSVAPLITEGSSNSINNIIQPFLPKRFKWTDIQQEILKNAYDKYPNQWEVIRTNFPELNEFTGVQIKDKYRATFGSRKSMTDSLVHALSGSLGSAGAMLVTYPLEQIRTSMQLRSQRKREKRPSWYQGCAAVVETVAVSNFLYFYSLQYSKNFLVNKISLSPISLAMTSSTLAAAFNILATEPLWKANTLLKTMPESEARTNNLLSIIVRIVKEEGIGSLWGGTRVSLWLISNPIIQFSIYEYVKFQFGQKKRPFTSAHAFLVGALSKAIATVATYPLQVAQTRLRVSTKSEMIDVLVELYRERSLFNGCQAKLAQTVLTAAFMFAFYERLAQILFSLLKR